MRVGCLAASALMASLAFGLPPVQSATWQPKEAEQAPGQIFGIGAGAMLPTGTFSQFNDPSYFVQSRSIYVEKIFGGRAAGYYGDTGGSAGIDGGRVYGFDFDFLVKFGSARSFGYVFAGGGYGKLTATSPDRVSGLPVRHSGYEWCWTGGLGYSFRHEHGFYVEASYVSYQTNPSSNFIPIVIGYQH